ncbi:hypothetical protein FD63_17490 [Xanthomonas translucens pv. undulosa]|nr:hypothetical protein FD63_17490 [Xanthomonas translucens pv. undulosa]
MDWVDANDSEAGFIDCFVDCGPSFGSRMVEAERQHAIIFEHSASLGKHCGELSGKNSRIFVLHLSLIR